jgi:hypothetical protein
MSGDLDPMTTNGRSTQNGEWALLAKSLRLHDQIK